MNRTLRLSAATVAVANLLAGCGGDPDAVAPATSPLATGSTIATTATASTATPATTPTPGAATTGSSEDARLLMYAHALMLMSTSREETIAVFSENISESEIESCMNAAGFEYIPEQSPEELVDADVRYSMSPEDYAATYGLGVAGWDLGVIPPLEQPRNQAAEWSMTQSEREAYNASLGQCRGGFDPERRVWSNAINIAVEQFRPVVDSDQRMTTALADWQSCMASAGYDFDAPMQMRGSFYARIGQGESLQSVFEDEVRVAVANAPCESAYTTTRRQVINDRFAEFKAFFVAARASGAAPEAQG